MEGETEAVKFHFQVADYVILAVIMLLSAGSGLYVSMVKHKQTSVLEYFLAGKNVPFLLVLLSYFSSYAAGGMMGTSIEVYTFGFQPILGILFSVPVIWLWLQYLIVPVFYKMQNISMLKYFEVRFGSTVSTIVMIAVIFQMVAVGTVNVYVAAITIHQVSDLSFWMAATVMIAICIIYSSLGGMRGIVLADAIQAIVMIFAILFVLIVGIIKNESLSALWNTNLNYRRLYIDWRFDPTLRYNFWSTLIGWTTMTIAFIASNQTLLQRCVMAPNLKAAQRIANVGSWMTHLYMLVFKCIGLVIFAYYKGCNLVSNGSIKTINQLVPYFAMEILHEFPGFSGVFFSGTLCATLSTVSSFLNSISALIMSPILQKSIIKSDKLATFLCKIIVLLFGGLMALGLIVVGHFPNFAQAAQSLLSVISGPTFALYCLSLICPQAKHKCVAVAYVVGLLFGVYMLIGSLLTSFKHPSLPFASCNSTQLPTFTNVTMSIASNVKGSMDDYFPLASVTHVYMAVEFFIVTFVCFILLSCFTGAQRKLSSEINLELIPQCIQRIQLKMPVRLRRILLCDVYNDSKEQPLMNETQEMSEQRFCPDT